ncbi:putative potassium channel regulatory protein [Latimeria chalumnae]|uniref:Potassium channel regulator n=1 Tax=Latimeria chalumnae TaxID=7897 RepID=H3B0A7_LATCH|nr:PREDICTED: potassium channel regulatory protein [Latimeria chalumnae]|eukprot:XP_006000631.1 PREDICTED: potassium channel regulatory protein [Latimeria chalumnae]
MSNQEVVVLNVGGMKFTTFPSTLRRYPDSKLARMLDGSDPDFRVVNGQFFVDRDGSLFRHILEYLRTRHLTLPPDFFEYERLAKEADFYGLQSLADLLSQDSVRQRLEILEVRFSLQETHSFFRIFCSSSSTIEMLAGRISIFAEQPVQSWSYPYPSQKPMAPVPLQRPSHHDLMFQCGTDYSGGEEFAARYASIQPDQRKLINGTNVLGLLVDILLKEGFHLISTRTVSAEEKVECYTFERIKRPEVFTVADDHRAENISRSYTKQGRVINKRK